MFTRRRGVSHTPYDYTHTILKQPYAIRLLGGCIGLFIN